MLICDLISFIFLHVDRFWYMVARMPHEDAVDGLQDALKAAGNGPAIWTVDPGLCFDERSGVSIVPYSLESHHGGGQPKGLITIQ